jgi:hypothetical protein
VIQWAFFVIFKYKIKFIVECKHLHKIAYGGVYAILPCIFPLSPIW